MSIAPITIGPVSSRDATWDHVLQHTSSPQSQEVSSPSHYKIYLYMLHIYTPIYSGENMPSDGALTPGATTPSLPSRATPGLAFVGSEPSAVPGVWCASQLWR